MSKITAMYIRLSMEDEDVSLNRKEESNLSLIHISEPTRH